MWKLTTWPFESNAHCRNKRNKTQLLRVNLRLYVMHAKNSNLYLTTSTSSSSTSKNSTASAAFAANPWWTRSSLGVHSAMHLMDPPVIQYPCRGFGNASVARTRYRTFLYSPIKTLLDCWMRSRFIVDAHKLLLIVELTRSEVAG